MQARNSATSVEPREPSETSGGSRRGSVVVAGQVVVTLAMIAGVGLWLLTTHGGAHSAANARSQPAIPTVTTSTAALAQPAGQPSGQAASAQPAAVQSAEVFTYYLVGSEAEAATLRDGLMHAVPAPNLQPGPYALVVVTSPEEETHALQEIHFEQRFENLTEADAAEMPFRIVDLRTPTPQSSSGRGSDCGALLPLHC